MCSDSVKADYRARQSNRRGPDVDHGVVLDEIYALKCRGSIVTGTMAPFVGWLCVSRLNLREISRVLRRRQAVIPPPRCTDSTATYAIDALSDGKYEHSVGVHPTGSSVSP